MTHVVVWINGEAVPAVAVDHLATLRPVASLVVAADGGLDAAMAHGLVVDVLVGDLDSASAHAQAAFAGEVRRHEVDKDRTDLELALDYALDVGAEQITVIGGGGGRLDHELATLLILASERYGGVEMRAVLGLSLVSVLRAGEVWSVSGVFGRPVVGSMLSLLAVDGPAVGVTTSGLRWNLHDETLPVGRGRGVSNVVVDDSAFVAIGAGTVLGVQPATE